MRVSANKKGELLSNLRNIFKPLLDQKGVQIFVHGSWADSTRTAFSDLDDFIVVDKSLPEEELSLLQSKLDEVEMLFQKIDPLQHHGHWLISKQELDDYDNSFIPLFIIEDALSIGDNNQIEASINFGKTKKGTINRIKYTCQNIENLFKQHLDNKLNIYNLKCLVGSFALLPPLIFQILGEDLDKRDAISRANEIFTEDSLKLLKWATDLRNNWQLVLNHDSYKSFINKLDKFSSAKVWRQHAAKHAPIIDFTHLSSVILTRELIDKLINETLHYVDKAKFKCNKLEDYIEGYALVETIALDSGAVLVGQFGNIKWPSISDLDVLICFPDQLYKAGIEKVEKAIQKDKTLNYLFTHPPVYISYTMLPYFKYLHTLYDLKISYCSLANFTIEEEVDDQYRTFYNNIWTFFLIKRIQNALENFKYYDSRALVLLLKNIHTSIYNIETTMGRQSFALETSDKIRSEFLERGVEARNIIEEAFKDGVKKFFLVLNEVSKNIKPSKECFIAGREYIFYASDKCRVEHVGYKNIFYLNSYLFNILYELLILRSSYIADIYLSSYEAVNSILDQLNAQKEDPFIPFLPKHLLIRQNTLKAQVKKIIYRFINFLPSFAVKELSKVL